MANNFKSTEVTLTNASETDIVAATSNNQIMIGLNACNRSTTASITLDVTLRDGSNYFKLAFSPSINSFLKFVYSFLFIGQFKYAGSPLSYLLALKTIS